MILDSKTLQYKELTILFFCRTTGTKLVNQSLVPLYYVDRHENGTFTTTFAEEYTHVVQFQTVISCDGCSDEEAFASEYPESFGDLTEDNLRRKLRLDGSRILNAGLVLNTIERKLNVAVPNLGRIGEVSISTEQNAPAKHMRSYYYEEEMVSTSHLHVDTSLKSMILCLTFNDCFVFYYRVEKQKTAKRS